MIGEQTQNHAIRIGAAKPLAFSILDIEAIIANGAACKQCGEIAWSTANSLSTELRKPEDDSTPSPENVIFTKKAKRIVGNFSRLIAKEHPDH